MLRPPPSSPLFPYTTLFRSKRWPSHVVVTGGEPMLLEPLCELTARLKEMDLHITIEDRKSTRLNSSHRTISYAVFCLKKKIIKDRNSFAPELHSVPVT